jgi:integrase
MGSGTEVTRFCLTTRGMSVGADCRNDLELVFAGPNGDGLKPDSISGSVSVLFKRLKIPKPEGAVLHLLRHTYTSILLAEGAIQTLTHEKWDPLVLFSVSL